MLFHRENEPIENLLLNHFCQLYLRIDATTKTTEKVAALKEYFGAADPADASWAIWFLIGKRIKRLVNTRLLRQWAREETGITEWMFEECYDRVGDLSETISLVLTPSEQGDDLPLRKLIEQELLPLKEMEDDAKREVVLKLWNRFDQQQLFVLGKLMMGGFRVGVSRRLVNRAVAEFSGIDPATIAHRLMGPWEPHATFFTRVS